MLCDCSHCSRTGLLGMSTQFSLGGRVWPGGIRDLYSSWEEWSWHQVFRAHDWYRKENLKSTQHLSALLRSVMYLGHKNMYGILKSKARGGRRNNFCFASLRSMLTQLSVQEGERTGYPHWELGPMPMAARRSQFSLCAEVGTVQSGMWIRSGASKCHFVLTLNYNEVGRRACFRRLKRRMCWESSTLIHHWHNNLMYPGWLYK